MNNIGFDFGDEEFVPGLIALVRPDGSAQLVAEGLAFPNGMAVTPDNSTLIVAESYGGALTAYDIAYRRQSHRASSLGRSGRRGTGRHLHRRRRCGLVRGGAGAPLRSGTRGRQRCYKRSRQNWAALPACLGGRRRNHLFVTAAAWPDAMTPGSRTGRDPGRRGFSPSCRLARIAPAQPGIRPSSDSLSSCRTSSTVESAARQDQIGVLEFLVRHPSSAEPNTVQ